MWRPRPGQFVTATLIELSVSAHPLGAGVASWQTVDEPWLTSKLPGSANAEH